MDTLKKRPWLWVVFAFVLLLAAWSSLIVIALKHRPQAVEIHPSPEATAGNHAASEP